MSQFEMSKTDLISWINQLLETKYAKIEQLCDCIAYIQLIHAYTDNLVHLNLVKCDLISQNTNQEFHRIQQSVAQAVHS